MATRPQIPGCDLFPSVPYPSTRNCKSTTKNSVSAWKLKIRTIPWKDWNSNTRRRLTSAKLSRGSIYFLAPKSNEVNKARMALKLEKCSQGLSSADPEPTKFWSHWLFESETLLVFRRKDLCEAKHDVVCVWNFAQNWKIWRGGKSYRWFGVNHTWQFEGKSSVRFTPLPPKRQVQFGHMGLFIWHLVSRVFWVKFLFLSQHLKREVGFFNFTTLLLIIYSLLQYNIHLCEICCCKCSKVAWTFY